MASTIGRVNRTQLSGFDYEWKIQRFPLLLRRENKSFSSPSFYFASHTWCLKIYTKQDKKHYQGGFYPDFSSSSHIGLYLRRISAGSPINLEFYLGIKSVDGRHLELHRSFNFQKAETGFGMSSYLSMSTLIKKKSEWLPAGVLTVLCTVKYPESAEDTYFRPLCEDYKNVLLNGMNHDLILKVGDKELKAHQDILMARSCVFKSILSHENKGVIDVPDCDPRAMELFLLYVYSGKAEALDQSNVFGLYYIADKYKMEDLKDKCSDFIKKSLSPINVCEAIDIATNHNDTELLENAYEYFRMNLLSTIRTAEWLSFLKKNPDLANKLLIKSVSIYQELRLEATT